MLRPRRPFSGSQTALRRTAFLDVSSLNFGGAKSTAVFLCPPRSGRVPTRQNVSSELLPPPLSPPAQPPSLPPLLLSLLLSQPPSFPLPPPLGWSQVPLST